MAGLSVRGDPQGWMDLGSAISTAAATLESELSGADVNGAQSLARSWYGPTAASFSASWASRRSRYEQLIGHLHSGGRAIAGYGQRLWELQQQAWSVESRAIEAGLRVTPLGDGFLPPPEAGLLPAPARMLIEHALADAAQGVERLFADVATAAEELLFTLGPVVTLLEDFCQLGLGALSQYGDKFIQELENHPWEVLHAAAEGAERATEVAVENAVTYASQLGYYLSKGTASERSAVAGFLRAAGHDAAHAGVTHDLVEVGEKAALVIMIATVGGEVVWGATAEHEGWLGSVERHAGDIASVAAGLIVAAALPEGLVGLGAAAVIGVTAVGVGALVQTAVDHRHAIIHAADGAVHDLEHLF